MAQVTVSYNAPVDTGGSTIIAFHAYAVEADLSVASADGTELSIVMNSPLLVAGTTYTFKVRAENVYGMGEWSNTVSYRIPTVPGAPTNVTVTI